MAFTHGIITTEKDTDLTPTVESMAGLPVIVGTAPINQAKEQYVNTPVLCSSYADAVEAFGFSKDFKNYTLCEFMYTYYALYGGYMAVFINVLDPAVHKTSGAKTLVVNNKEAILEEEGVILESLVISGVSKEEYICAFDTNGHVMITLTSDAITVLDVTFDRLDASLVTKEDIIGGINANGRPTGLELIKQVYPRYGLEPGILLAPGFSTDEEVTAIMNAKTNKISSLFNCMSVTDIPETITKYTDAVEWKSSCPKSANHILCFGKLRLGDVVFNMSGHLASLMVVVDGDNDGIPSESPSNKGFNSSALVVNGADEYLDLEEANYLNANGIVTALNIGGELRAWGNRTSIYPVKNDVKDVFIPVKRMFHFIANTFTRTFFDKVDKTVNRRLIDTVVDSFNLYLNGLSGRGYMIDARIEFRSDENPVTDLIGGIYRFHTYLTPGIPAETIENVFEIDASKYELLFSEA